MKRKKGAYRAYSGNKQVKVSPIPNTNLWKVLYRDDSGHWGTISETITSKADAFATAKATLERGGRIEQDSSLISRIQMKVKGLA